MGSNSQPYLGFCQQNRVSAGNVTRRDRLFPMPVYACLADGCTQVFRVWQQARLHMRSCSENFCDLGKPKLSDSLAKGKLIAPDDFDVADANDPFKGKLIVPEPPSEAAIVSVLEQYSNRCSDSMTFRKHASAHLREHFGHFPFAAFGFGTLKEFLFNHGFHTPDFDAMAARDLWMDNVTEDLAPCQRCRRAFSREAFSKTQLQKWDAKGRRARPHCRACLEDRERRRGRPSKDTEVRQMQNHLAQCQQETFWIISRFLSFYDLMSGGFQSPLCQSILTSR